MKIFRKLMLFALTAFLVIWGLSLAKCEVLTALHGDEFLNAYKESDIVGEIEYFKILNYSRDHAEIYFVGKGNSIAEILAFRKYKGEWKYDNWYRTVWSALGGSASEVIWPYWWHFIYGGL